MITKKIKQEPLKPHYRHTIDNYSMAVKEVYIAAYSAYVQWFLKSIRSYPEIIADENPIKKLAFSNGVTDYNYNWLCYSQFTNGFIDNVKNQSIYYLEKFEKPLNLSTDLLKIIELHKIAQICYTQGKKCGERWFASNFKSREIK